jgi:hypothetical protein
MGSKESVELECQFTHEEVVAAYETNDWPVWWEAGDLVPNRQAFMRAYSDYARVRADEFREALRTGGELA